MNIRTLFFIAIAALLVVLFIPISCDTNNPSIGRVVKYIEVPKVYKAKDTIPKSKEIVPNTVTIFTVPNTKLKDAVDSLPRIVDVNITKTKVEITKMDTRGVVAVSEYDFGINDAASIRIDATGSVQAKPKSKFWKRVKNAAIITGAAITAIGLYIAGRKSIE